MRVIPGTQSVPLHPMVSRQDTPNVLGCAMPEDMVDESKAVDVILKAGDVSIHHPNIIHGSNANTSDRWRRGLTIRYIPTRTRITSETPWPCAILLRGQPVDGINQYLPRPRWRREEHMPFKGCETFGDPEPAAV
jgi:phytanoyl-CoA hydroxylase